MTIENQPLWVKVWRNGLAPHLPTEGMERLAEALRTDATSLLQGATTSPPPLACVEDFTCEGACPISYCGLVTSNETVGEIELFFARICRQCDESMREVAACHWFLNWVDETPRDEMRRELLREVERTLSLRGLESQYLVTAGDQA